MPHMDLTMWKSGDRYQYFLCLIRVICERALCQYPFENLEYLSSGLLISFLDFRFQKKYLATVYIWFLERGNFGRRPLIDSTKCEFLFPRNISKFSISAFRFWYDIFSELQSS